MKDQATDILNTYMVELDAPQICFTMANGEIGHHL